MKSDLDELIELCEAEKQSLEDCIKDNTEEYEYLHAHYHSQALFAINHQLQVLYKLRDPFYDEKVQLERMIGLYEKWDKIEGLPNLDSYYEKEIKDNKNKLEELNKQKNKPLYDDQKIDDALFVLLKGDNQGFILFLNKKDNLSFTFELSAGNMLDISISVKSVLNVEYFFDDDDDDEVRPIKKFKGMGFAVNETRNKLIYKYDMKKFKEAGAIKKLLAHIIYDVFRYADLDNPASLVYF
jgi:hypothetical protein